MFMRRRVGELDGRQRLPSPQGLKISTQVDGILRAEGNAVGIEDFPCVPDEPEVEVRDPWLISSFKEEPPHKVLVCLVGCNDVKGAPEGSSKGVELSDIQLVVVIHISP